MLLNFRAGILLVVAVGVAMGVFVGGVLLVCAARHVRRYVFIMHGPPCGHVLYISTRRVIMRTESSINSLRVHNH